MDIDQGDEEKILSFVSEAINWREDEKKEKIDEIVPILSRYYSSNKDFKVSIQIIQFTLNSFLPTISLSRSELLKITLSSLSNGVEALVKGAQNNPEMVQFTIEDLISCIELCHSFLCYLMSRDILLFEMVYSLLPYVLSAIKSAIVQYKKKDSDNHQSNLEVCNSLLSVVNDSCSLLCDIIVKIQWSTINGNSEMGKLVAKLAEEVAVVAHSMSTIGEVKISLKLWKTVVFFLKDTLLTLRKHLMTENVVMLLYYELKEALNTLKSFAADNSEDVEEIFIRVLKWGGFILKILILIANSFTDHLRGASFAFVCVVRILLRFSAGFDSPQLKIDLRTSINDQLCSGALPLLSSLRKDEDFLKEIAIWSESSERKASDLFEEENEKGTETNVFSWSSFLLLLNSLLKVSLQDPFDVTAVDKTTHVLFKKIIEVLPHCHAELNSPVAYEASPNLQEISLYEHTLIHSSALVSVMGEEEFESVEKILFRSLFSSDPWLSLFASDLICFVARYGSPELCESHCHLLSDYVKKTPPGKGHSTTLISLLSRLMGFINPEVVQKIFLDWASDEKLNKLTMAKVLSGINSNFESFPPVSTLFNNLEANLDVCFESEEALIGQKIELMMESLSIVQCLSGRFVSESDCILKKSLIDSLMKIFLRIPKTLIGCTAVSGLFCSCLAALTTLSRDISDRDIYRVLCMCSEVLEQKTFTEVNIYVGNFISSLSNRNIKDKFVINKVEGMFIKLFSSSGSLSSISAVENFVHFSQNKKYEQVFSNVIGQISEENKGKVRKYVKIFSSDVDEQKPQLVKDHLQRYLSHSNSSIPKVIIPIPDCDEAKFSFGMRKDSKEQMGIVLNRIKELKTSLKRLSCFEDVAKSEVDLVKSQLEGILNEWNERACDENGTT